MSQHYTNIKWIRSLLKTTMFLFCITCSFKGNALEFKVLLDNAETMVAWAKIDAHEEIGLHRDEYPEVVIALKGGTITRLEADGSTTDVVFPNNVAVYRPADPINELHRSVNNGNDPVELIIILFKTQQN